MRWAIATTAMICLSLTPGLLPRPALAQALLTGVLAFSGSALVSTFGLQGVRKYSRARSACWGVCAVVLVVAVSAADSWQDKVRAAMGMPGVGPGHWALVAFGSTIVWLVLFGSALVIGRGARWLGVTGTAAAVVVLGLFGQYVVAPAAVDWRMSVYQAANGRIGERFLGGAAGSVRVYGSLDSAPDADSRAALTVAELERAGGLDRSNIVVAIPTGSGWIDEQAATGFEQRFGGDVALVGMQYSVAPSWATFVFGRRAAETAANALYHAIEQRLQQLPHPPRLYLYGQSLGALAAASVQPVDLCGALLAGPPPGKDLRAATVLANSSDPVVRWSPRLLIHAPDLSKARVDAPLPQWLPVLSYLQTSVDLLGALDAPPGHGHRYGTDQGTAMPTC